MISRMLALAFVILVWAAPSRAAQVTCIMPTSGTVSGLTLVQDINACNGSLLSIYSGATAPSSPTTFMLWMNTALNAIQQYDGTNWNTIWFVDATNHLIMNQIGGGAATISSATSTDLCSVPQNYLTILGSTTIAGFGSSCPPGVIKFFTLGGSITLTNSGSLANPSNLDIPGVAGDSGIAVAAGGGNWVIVSYTKKDGTPLVANVVTAQALQVSARAQGSLINLQLNATAASSILTVSVVGANGSAPSALNPVLIPFRDVTVANGDPVWRSLTSSLSVSTIVGASLGSLSSNVPFRFWVVVFDNAGTLALGLVNCSTANQIYPAINNEAGLQTSVSMTSAATSPGVIYTQNGTTITTKAFKILGHLDYASGLGTAGTYASPPTSIVLFGPGIKKPGEVLQDIYVNNSVAATTTNAYTPSATLPTPAGGILIASQAITPTAFMNPIRVQAQATGATSTANNNSLFIYDATNAVARSVVGGGSAGNNVMTLTARFQTLISATTTFAAYFTSQSGTTTLNGASGSQFFTGAANSYIHIQEIMGALPQAVNDNGTDEVSMVV